MGRRKIVIAPITSERNRSVTYVKRKAGLFKKAHELAVLTDASIAVIVFGHNGKLSEFCSGDIDKLLLRYTEYNGPVERKGPESFGGEDDDDDDDDADGGGAAGGAGGAGSSGNQPYPGAGPSNQRANGRNRGADSGPSYYGAAASHPGANFTFKSEDDQSPWQDVNTSSTSTSKQNLNTSSRSSTSPRQTSKPTFTNSRRSRRISGRTSTEKGNLEENSNASDLDSEDESGNRESAKIKSENEAPIPQAMYTGKQFTKNFQPREEGEHKEGRDALKAAINSRGTAKGPGATAVRGSSSSVSKSDMPADYNSQGQSQPSHLRHLSEGSNSNRFPVPDSSSIGTAGAATHRPMQGSASFSGPSWGFSSSASPASQLQGVSPDLHAAGLASQMRPFTAHGTGIGMAASTANQYQHMMGSASNGPGLSNPNLPPSSFSSYAYLQTGGYNNGLPGTSSSSRPMTAHGTGQATHYSSQSPFSPSPAPQPHPSNSHSYPQGTTYRDLSGPVAPASSQFYDPNQPSLSNQSANKGYAMNFGVGNANSSHQPQQQYATARPVSQDGIPQMQQSHFQPLLPPGAHPTLMQHPQFPEYARSIQARQSIQSSQGSTGQPSIQNSSQTSQQQEEQQQRSRPSSRGGVMHPTDDSASPFSHTPTSLAIPQDQSSSARLGVNSTSSLDTSSNSAPASSTSAGPSPSIANDQPYPFDAQDRKALSGNTLAGQKRKSFELDDVTLGSLATSSDLTMSNFRYDLSSASGDLGHPVKSARPSTSGGEMGTGFSRDHVSSMLESSDLVGGATIGSGRISSSSARPSSTGHASSSSSIGSFSTIPALSISSSSSEAGGDRTLTSREGNREREESSNNKAFNDLVGSFLESETPNTTHQSPSKSSLSISESPNFSIHSAPMGSNPTGLKGNHHLDLVNHHDNNQRSFEEAGLTSLDSR